MTARRPPSLRDPDNYGQRLANGLRAMAKGSDSGRVLQAAPVTVLPETNAPDVEAENASTQTLPFSNTGTLAIATGTHRMYLERAGTITNVRAAVGTAPTGAAVKVDVNLNGTTIFTTQSNRPTIAISGFTALAADIDVSTFNSGDYLTVDVDQVGSTIAGSDLTLTVEIS